VGSSLLLIKKCKGVAECIAKIILEEGLNQTSLVPIKIWVPSLKISGTFLI
jgi:hypothetical protein